MVECKFQNYLYCQDFLEIQEQCSHWRQFLYFQLSSLLEYLGQIKDSIKGNIAIKIICIIKIFQRFGNSVHVRDNFLIFSYPGYWSIRDKCLCFGMTFFDKITIRLKVSINTICIFERLWNNDHIRHNFLFYLFSVLEYPGQMFVSLALFLF